MSPKNYVQIFCIASILVLVISEICSQFRMAPINESMYSICTLLPTNAIFSSRSIFLVILQMLLCSLLGECGVVLRTRVLLKKSNMVLDLVPPPTIVHNLIFGRTWIDSPGDMVMSNLTTGDKVILYFQPCGWFGYVPLYVFTFLQYFHSYYLFDAGDQLWTFTMIKWNCIMCIALVLLIMRAILDKDVLTFSSTSALVERDATRLMDMFTTKMKSLKY